MNITAIGHLCLDYFHFDEVNVKESVGGIIYSFLGFYLSGAKKDSIIPVFNISEEEFIKFRDVFERLGYTSNYLNKTDKAVNKVHLYFTGEKVKFECYEQTAEIIPIENFNDNILNQSHFYINMISGKEILSEDLKKLRQLTKNLIYFDFHTLTKGMDKQGKRYFRSVEKLNEWLENVDIIQVNEDEWHSLTNESLTEEEFAEKILNSGPRLINITKGEKGATSYFYEKSIIKRIDFKSKNIKPVKNTVGCGDIFGASYFYNYVCGKTPEECLMTAVTIAGKRTEYDLIYDILEDSDNIKFDL